MTGWTVRRIRRPGAGSSLYCFPHAGGSPGEYVRWSDELPDVQLWGMHLPGRTTRSAEPAFTRVAPLVDAVLSAVRFTPPFTLFGHSLGALVAFEVARELRRRDLPAPERLILSSCPAPPFPAPSRPVHTLPDDDLLAEIERRSGDPLDHLRDDPVLRAAALACYRADFALLENHVHVPGRPLDCPVTLLAGADERLLPDAEAWAAYTGGPVERRLLPGGHFYFRTARPQTLSVLRETVSTTKGDTEWTG